MRTAQVAAINKLAVAGEQAGFTLEQMIQYLDSDLTVERGAPS
jgi:phage protein D